MANDAPVDGHFRDTTAIDLKATGATIIVSAASGKKFIPIAVRLYITTKTAATIGPTVSVGTNSATFDNLCAAQTAQVSTLSAPFVEVLLMNGGATTEVPVLDLTNPIKLNVSVAATGTALQGILLIEGLIV